MAVPPCARPAGAATEPTGFGADLLEYLRALRQIGLRPPADWQPQGQGAAWSGLDVEWVRRYDFAGCAARLVGSVPGRHTGSALRKWGPGAHTVHALPPRSVHSSH